MWAGISVGAGGHRSFVSVTASALVHRAFDLSRVSFLRALNHFTRSERGSRFRLSEISLSGHPIYDRALEGMVLVRRKGARALSLYLGLAILGAYLTLGVPTAAASDLCGATITTSLKLDHDLECAGAGIAVGADGVTLWLNGHAISGPDAMDASISGIVVMGRTDVTIKGPGTVMGFFAGVRIVGSSDVEVKGLTVTGSHEAGIRLEGSTGVQIKGNTVFGGGHDAVQLRNSHGNVVKGNVATATAPPGCAVNLVSSNNNIVKENSLSNSGTSAVQFPQIPGLPPSSGNIIKENKIFDSTHGVRAFAGATGNVVSENEIFGNANGISFVGPTPEALGNVYRENEIAGNQCAIKGSATELAGNTFVENEFVDNVSDVCTE